MLYFCPDSLPTLHEIIGKLNPGSFKLLAGGTDLLVQFESGKELPQNLIDIKKIPALAEIKKTDTSLEIGGLVSVEKLRKDPCILETVPALSQAASQFAGLQIRNRATIAGNICNASPAGDLLPALYASDAVLKLSSVVGVRKTSISEFITGPGKTTLKPGELLESISIPLSNERTEFFKLGLRQSMAISVVNFALRYHVENGSFRTLKIAVGSVAPTVVLLTAYSSAVLDTPTNISAALNKIEEDITPIDDIRATADYRRRVLKNVLEFTLKRAIGDSDV